MILLSLMHLNQLSTKLKIMALTLSRRWGGCGTWAGCKLLFGGESLADQYFIEPGFGPDGVLPKVGTGCHHLDASAVQEVGQRWFTEWPIKQ